MRIECQEVLWGLKLRFLNAVNDKGSVVRDVHMLVQGTTLPADPLRNLMVDAKDVNETHGANLEERGQWLSPEATFGDGDVLGTPEVSLDCVTRLEWIRR